MNSTWRMYAWSLVALMVAVIWLHGCGRMIPAPPGWHRPGTMVFEPELSKPAELAANAGDRERAAYFKDLSQRYAAESVRFAKIADEKDLRARQLWFNIVGGFAIALGLAAIIFSFFSAMTGFLRVAGAAAIAVGIAAIILAEALPYLWMVALVALAAIVAAMVVNHGALKAAIGSWKDAAGRLPDAAKAAADEASLSLQTPTIRGHMTKLLRKF